MNKLFKNLSTHFNHALIQINMHSEQRQAHKSLMKSLHYLTTHEMIQENLPLIASDKELLCFYSTQSVMTHNKHSTAYQKNALILPNGDMYRLHDYASNEGATLKKTNVKDFKRKETDEGFYNLVYETLVKPELSIMPLSEIIELFEKRIDKKDYLSNQYFNDLKEYYTILSEKALLSHMISTKSHKNNKNKI